MESPPGHILPPYSPLFGYFPYKSKCMIIFEVYLLKWKKFKRRLNFLFFNNFNLLTPLQCILSVCHVLFYTYKSQNLLVENAFLLHFVLHRTSLMHSTIIFFPVILNDSDGARVTPSYHPAPPLLNIPLPHQLSHLYAVQQQQASLFNMLAAQEASVVSGISHHNSFNFHTAALTPTSLLVSSKTIWYYAAIWFSFFCENMLWVIAKHYITSLL